MVLLPEKPAWQQERSRNSVCGVGRGAGRQARCKVGLNSGAAVVLPHTKHSGAAVVLPHTKHSGAAVVLPDKALWCCSCAPPSRLCYRP
eukprot:351937-Chlamydomonas_euryale.AAC.16